MDLQSLAKTILSGANQLGVNAQQDYANLTSPEYIRSPEYGQKQSQLADSIYGISGSVKKITPSLLKQQELVRHARQLANKVIKLQQSGATDQTISIYRKALNNALDASRKMRVE